MTCDNPMSDSQSIADNQQQFEARGRRLMPTQKTMARYDEVLVALRRLIRATDLHSKRLSKTTGLTSPQLLIMQAIRDLGQVTVGKIAKEVNLSQATVTNIMDRLESRGWVVRQRSTQDKRKVHAYLTEAGRDKVLEAPTPLQAQFINQFQDLEDWEQSMILASLQRIAQMMDARHIDASPFLDVGDIDRHLDDPRRAV